MSKRIGDLMTVYGSDKDTVHSYGQFYDDLLSGREITAMLEVGVLGGSSLRAWRAFFPAAVTVVGMDIDAPSFEIDGVQLVQADSTREDEVNLALGQATFDLIVDDGCHWEKEQLQTWELLYPRVRPGGVYVVEDIQQIESGKQFESRGAEIHDRRSIRYRGDDILAVFRKPKENKWFPIT